MFDDDSGSIATREMASWPSPLPRDPGGPHRFPHTQERWPRQPRGPDRSMKLTRASSYALHAVAYMATQKQQDKPVASHHIAQARGIPERFLLKVLKPLVSARVLLSIKGPNGGYRLAKKPDDITMLEILEAVDGPIRGLSPLTEESNGPLNKRLEVICTETADSVKKQLARV